MATAKADSVKRARVIDARPRLSPVSEAARRYREMKRAARMLAAEAARAESAREAGLFDFAEMLEIGAVSRASTEAAEAEAALFAAPSLSLRDFALKVLTAAEYDFECAELNYLLGREAVRLARAEELADRA